MTGEVLDAKGEDGKEKEVVIPGDTNVTFHVKLHAPIAMNDNDRFAIREGGKTVGSGVVTKIIK